MSGQDLPGLRHLHVALLLVIRGSICYHTLMEMVAAKNVTANSQFSHVPWPVRIHKDFMAIKKVLPVIHTTV